MTIQYEIVNAVWTGDFGKHLNLDEIAASYPSRATFEVEKYPGVRWKDTDSKNSLLVFSSGKFVMNRHIESEQVRSVLQDFIESYNSLFYFFEEYQLTMPEFKLQNLVATGTVGRGLNLELLSLELENTIYEPEQLPGLIWRIPEFNATVVLFGSGSFNVTGVRSTESLESAVDRMRCMLNDE